MSTKPKIAIVIGSTRATRWADKPAAWMLKQVQARSDMEGALVDLRDFDLPLYDEPAPVAMRPSENPHVVKFAETISGFDGFIFVTPEYNRSIPASLKNALDSIYAPWVRKPFGVFGYGSMGAGFAIQHLRNVGVAVQMVPVSSMVMLGGADFFRVGPWGSEPLENAEGALLPATATMLDDLLWWTKATMAAKA